MIRDNTHFEIKHKLSYSTISPVPQIEFVFSFYKNNPLKRMKRGCWSHTDEFIPLLDLDKHL
jgi:hypothetical protein